MYCTKHTVLALVAGLCCLSAMRAQDNYTVYVQPQFALNYKVTPNLSHNFSLVQRSYLYEGETFKLRARQIDIGHFSNLKVFNDQSFSLGIAYRFRSNFEPGTTNELRLMQQYNVTFKPRTVRYGHRFRAEQRIFPKVTVHRFRYRAALDLPLQGEELDLGETYFVAATESLLSISKNSLPEYDQRFSAEIGWFLAEKTKFQAGIEYRFENFTHGVEHVVFFNTNLIISL